MLLPKVLDGSLTLSASFYVDVKTPLIIFTRGFFSAHNDIAQIATILQSQRLLMHARIVVRVDTLHHQAPLHVLTALQVLFAMILDFLSTKSAILADIIAWGTKLPVLIARLVDTNLITVVQCV